MKFEVCFYLIDKAPQWAHDMARLLGTVRYLLCRGLPSASSRKVNTGYWGRYMKDISAGYDRTLAKSHPLFARIRTRSLWTPSLIRLWSGTWATPGDSSLAPMALEDTRALHMPCVGGLRREERRKIGPQSPPRLVLTFTNVSTAPFAMSSIVGRAPMKVLWFIEAEVSMRNTMIVILGTKDRAVTRYLCGKVQRVMAEGRQELHSRQWLARDWNRLLFPLPQTSPQGYQHSRVPSFILGQILEFWGSCWGLCIGHEDWFAL